MGTASFGAVKGFAVGRRLAGDFNRPSRDSAHRSWTGPRGLWELQDPMLPTYPSGGAPERPFYEPADQIPFVFLPCGGSLDVDDTRRVSAKQFYPVRAFAGIRLGNHHPALLGIPYGVKVSRCANVCSILKPSRRCSGRGEKGELPRPRSKYNLVWRNSWVAFTNGCSVWRVSWYVRKKRE